MAKTLNDLPPFFIKYKDNELKVFSAIGMRSLLYMKSFSEKIVSANASGNTITVTLEKGRTYVLERTMYGGGTFRVARIM